MRSCRRCTSRVATAFPHRNATAVLQMIASWAPDGTGDASRRWLADAAGQARKRIGTAAYANYANADLADWQNAYYGANYARLQQVKRQYDPGRLFDGPQAI